MTLGELIRSLLLLHESGVDADKPVEIVIDNSDHYASGNYERRPAQSVTSGEKVVISC